MAEFTAAYYRARAEAPKVWYRAETRNVDGNSDTGREGWTSNPGYAAVSYGVGDGKGTAFTGPEAFLAPWRCRFCDIPGPTHTRDDPACRSDRTSE